MCSGCVPLNVCLTNNYGPVCLLKGIAVAEVSIFTCSLHSLAAILAIVKAALKAPGMKPFTIKKSTGIISCNHISINQFPAGLVEL